MLWTERILGDLKEFLKSSHDEIGGMAIPSKKFNRHTAPASDRYSW